MKALKNCAAYQIERPESLESFDLSPFELQPCPPSEMRTAGFVRWDDGHFIQTFGGVTGLRFGVNARLLPSKVVADAAKALAAQIAETEGRVVGHKEMRELKERATFELMPRSHVMQSTTLVVIYQDFLFIDAATIKKADEVSAHLRKAFGGKLALLPVTLDIDPAQIMTHWVEAEEYPPGLSPGGTCTLRAMFGERARFDQSDLSGPSVRSMVNRGANVVDMELHFQGDFSARLDDALLLKQIKLTASVDDVVMDKIGSNFDSADQHQMLSAQATLTLQAEFLANAYRLLIAAANPAGEV